MPLVPDLNPDIDRLSKTKAARVAWKVLGSLFVAALLVFGSLQVAVALAHEEYTDVDSFSAAGVNVVEIQNSAGGVRVSAAPESIETIEVTANVSDGLRETEHTEQMDGDRLLLEAECPMLGSTFCDVEYVVHVPADVQLVVRAIDGVTVSDIAGEVDLESQSSVSVAGLSGHARLRGHDGSVRATDLRSSVVDASTVSGDVVVDFDSSPQSVRSSSIDGDVEVVIPDDEAASYRVETSTVDGDNPIPDIRVDPEGNRSIVAETIAGDVIVRYS